MVLRILLLRLALLLGSAGLVEVGVWAISRGLGPESTALEYLLYRRMEHR
ncbi:MAG: hypothetical protein K0041_03355 [Acidithiobacillus sp.]|nr:hypothetical protein [Acidithiobacillus sp.]